MAFAEEELIRVCLMKAGIQHLAKTYNFILGEQYVSDCGLIGIKIYHYLLENYLSNKHRKFKNGYVWEGDYGCLIKNIVEIHKLYDNYKNIELIIPFIPDSFFIKYDHLPYFLIKNCMDYNHEYIIEEDTNKYSIFCGLCDLTKIYKLFYCRFIKWFGLF